MTATIVKADTTRFGFEVWQHWNLCELRSGQGLQLYVRIRCRVRREREDPILARRFLLAKLEWLELPEGT